MQMEQWLNSNAPSGERNLKKLNRGLDTLIIMIYNPHLMEKISNTEIKLSRKQYLKVGSDYDILTHLYEMKLGHELRVSGQDFILKFFDENSLEMFIGDIYNK